MVWCCGGWWRESDPPDLRDPEQSPELSNATPIIQLKPQLHPWALQNLQLHPHETPPFPRHGHALPATATDTGYLFLFGGTFRDEPRNDLYLLSPYHKSATLLDAGGDKPPALVGHASALVRNMVVVWGGQSYATGATDSEDSDVYVLQLDKDPFEWRRHLVRGPAPVGRSGHAVTHVNSNFFVFGGLAGKKCLNDLWMLDISTTSWKLYDVSLRGRPCGRTGHICFAYGNEIFTFGGTNGKECYNDTWSFNLHSDRWSELTCTGEIPSPRYRHSGALVEHTLYLFGGMGSNGARLDDLYAFNIPKREWFRFRALTNGPAPSGRSGHAMASMGTDIFIVGGGTVGKMEEHSCIHVLDTVRLDYPQLTSTTMINYPPVPMMPKLYKNLFETLMTEAGQGPDKIHRITLHAYAENMASRNIIMNLTHSTESRLRLLEMAYNLHVPDTRILEALEKDDQDISRLLREIAKSSSDKKAVMQLRGQDAQVFVDLLKMVLDQGIPSDKGLHRLLVNLSEASDRLPSTLFLKGVKCSETNSEHGGGFADVYRGEFKGKKVALKRLRIFKDDTKRRESQRLLCREILLWQGMRHPCIVPLLGIDEVSFSPLICMVSPWMVNGTLLRFTEANGLGNVNQHICDVAEGLAYLHSENIVHGDVRGNNILINDEMRACLTDFGLTVFANATDPRSTAGRGSPRWMAPELFTETDKFPRTSASDVWAFGCLCVELYTGLPPFPDMRTDYAAMMHVVRGGRPGRPPGMHDDLWDITTQCWALRDRRLSMDQVVDKLQGLGFGGSALSFRP